MDAFADKAIEQTFNDVAGELEAKGADQETAKLCANRAVDLGIEYDIQDVPSLVGIGELLGRYDAKFYEAPSIDAALLNSKVSTQQRVGRILNSSVLMKRIVDNIPAGVDRRLRARSSGSI